MTYIPYKLLSIQQRIHWITVVSLIGVYIFFKQCGSTVRFWVQEMGKKDIVSFHGMFKSPWIPLQNWTFGNFVTWAIILQLFQPYKIYFNVLTVHTQCTCMYMYNFSNHHILSQSLTSWKNVICVHFNCISFTLLNLQWKHKIQTLGTYKWKLLIGQTVRKKLNWSWITHTRPQWNPPYHKYNEEYYMILTCTQCAKK